MQKHCCYQSPWFAQNICRDQSKFICYLWVENLEDKNNYVYYYQPYRKPFKHMTISQEVLPYFSENKFNNVICFYSLLSSSIAVTDSHCPIFYCIIIYCYSKRCSYLIGSSISSSYRTRIIINRIQNPFNILINFLCFLIQIIFVD